MTTLDAATRARLRTLDAAATPGTWEAIYLPRFGGWCVAAVADKPPTRPIIGQLGDDEQAGRDAEAIAELHNAGLPAALDAACAQIGGLQGELAETADAAELITQELAQAHLDRDDALERATTAQAAADEHRGVVSALDATRRKLTNRRDELIEGLRQYAAGHVGSDLAVRVLAGTTAEATREAGS